MRAKIAQAAVVAVLSISAVAYGALEKHVSVRVDGSTIRLGTFAGTVAETLERGGVDVGPNDVVRPPLSSSVREGVVIEIGRAKQITLLLNGSPRQAIVTALTVEDVIQELNLRSSLVDFVDAPRDARVTAGMVLVYRNAVGIKVAHDGVVETVITNAATIGEVLGELGVALAARDEVSPMIATAPHAGLVVSVHRIGTRTVTKSRAIAFSTVMRPDPNMERGLRATRRPGRSGERAVTYRVTYKDGKIVAQKELSSRVVRKPVARIVAYGTGPRCICTRGTQTGDATWYRRSGLTAAHPTLPFGTVVRVTNLANGRTVNVTINDRGPYGDGRIIDVSDDAFERLAGLSEGVIAVRIRW